MSMISSMNMSSVCPVTNQSSTLSSHHSQTILQAIVTAIAAENMPWLVNQIIEKGKDLATQIFNGIHGMNQAMQHVDPWRFPGVQGLECQPKKVEIMKNGNRYYTINDVLYGPYKETLPFNLTDNKLQTQFIQLLPPTHQLLKIETSTLCPLSDTHDLEPTETEGVLEGPEGIKFVKSGLAKSQFNEKMLAQLEQDSLVTLTRTPAVSEEGSLLSFTKQKTLSILDNADLSNLNPAILAFIFIPSLHGGDSYKIENKFLVLDTEGFSFSEQNIAKFLPKSIAKQLLMKLNNEGEIYKTFEKIDIIIDSYLDEQENISLQEEGTLLSILLSGITTDFIAENEQIIKSLYEHDKNQEDLPIDIEQSMTVLQKALDKWDAKRFFYKYHENNIKNSLQKMDLSNSEIYKLFKKIDRKIDSVLDKQENMLLQEDNILLNTLLSDIVTDFLAEDEQIIKSLYEHDKKQEDLSIDREQSMSVLQETLDKRDEKIKIFSKSIKTNLIELSNREKIYKTFKAIDIKLDSFLEKLNTLSLQDEDTLLNTLLSGVTADFIDKNEQIIESLCEHDKKQERLSIDIEQSITALKAALGSGDAKRFFYENHKKRITIFSKSIKTLLQHQEQDKRLNMWQVFAKYVYKELVDSLVPLPSEACPLVDFSDDVINSMTGRVRNFIDEHGKIEPQRVLSNILSHLEGSLKLNPDLS